MNYVKCLWLFLLFSFPLFAEDDELATLKEALAAPQIYHSVNVITGEYCESANDIELAGPYPVTLRRCYNSSDPSAAGWCFNHPNVLRRAEPLPTGDLSTFHYELDFEKRLKCLKIGDFQGKRAFHQLNFTYEKGDHLCCIVNSDQGDIVRYNYRQLDSTRYGEAYLLESVIFADGAEYRYQYKDHPRERKKQLIRREAPEGCILEIEYYDDKGSKVKCLRESNGPDGTIVITSRFVYFQGYTEVYDAYDNKMIYRFGKNHRLTAIEEYYVNHGEERLYRVERYKWDEDKNLLQEKTLEDGEGHVLVSHIYTYDENGNMTAHILNGSLSATKTEEDEQYAINYWYSQDHDPILKGFKEDNGRSIKFTYEPITRRLIAKFTCEHDKIIKRELYNYDDYGILCQSIIDDGSSENTEDLTNVTERHIYKMKIRQKFPAIGLAEVVDEYTSDNKLLKQTLNTFSNHGRVIEQKILSSHGETLEHHTYEYDHRGRPNKISNYKGEEIILAYDKAGNMTSRKSGTIESKFVYLHGKHVQTIEADSEGKQTCTTYDYDLKGNRVSETDTYGNKTYFTYDPWGRISKCIFPSVLNENDLSYNSTIDYEYDHFNRCTKKSISNETTSTSYNIRGKPTQIIYADGTKEHFQYYLDGTLKKQTDQQNCYSLMEYDVCGRITSCKRFDASHTLIYSEQKLYSTFRQISELSNNKETYFHYDLAGRLRKKNVKDSEHIHNYEYEYDENGKLIGCKEWTDQNQPIQLNFKYDQDGKLEEIQAKDDSRSIQKQALLNDATVDSTEVDDAFHTNERGQLVMQKRITTKDGLVTVITYDALKRIEKVVNNSSNIERRYDANGNCLKEKVTLDSDKQPKQIISAWKYGPNNRLLSATEAVGTFLQCQTHYTYDECGRLSSVTKPDGVRIEYSYHPSGKLSRMYSSDGTINYYYTYNVQQQLVLIEDALNGTKTKRTYNSEGDLLTETLGTDIITKNQYDSRGRRTKLILPDQTFISYEYDALYLKAVHRHAADDSIHYSHIYSEYDEQGKLLSADMICGLGKINYKRDSSEIITEITSPYWSEKGNHQCITINDSMGEITSPYKYDEKCQVIEELNYTYTYDALGNRTSKNSESFTYDDLQQIVKPNLAYDKNGNPLNSIDNLIYQYDALDRLIAVTEACKWCVRYDYDAFNRRISKTFYEWNNEWCLTDTQLYIYDGDNEIGSINSSGQITELRVLGIGQGAEIGATVAIEINGEAYAAINDLRGSISCLVDTRSGKVSECYRYTAFGEMNTHSVEGYLGNPWKYSGKRYDDETGLVYFGKRYYSPQQGRWLTRDPLGCFDGANPYIYVKNNPLQNRDLYGLFSFNDFLNYLKVMSDGANRVFGGLKYNLSYWEYASNDIEPVLESVLGSSFLLMSGFYQDTSEWGVHGNGEIHDNVRVSMVNGILNSRFYFKHHVDFVSECHGGMNIHYVFHATEGAALDSIKAIMVRLGYVSPQATHLAEMWKAMIADMGGPGNGGVIIHYAHSLGGADTLAAKNMLTPEEQKMIHVITIGSFVMLQDEGFASVINYVSVRDGIPLMDPVGYANGHLNDNSNVIYIGGWLGVPFIDHYLLADTYSELVQMLGRQFLETYSL